MVWLVLNIEFLLQMCVSGGRKGVWGDEWGVNIAYLIDVGKVDFWFSMI